MQKALDIPSLAKLIKENQADFQQRGVKSLAVFGSLARGEITPTSDIDFLVEFNRPVGLFEFVRLKMKLEEMFGTQIDLVTPDAIRLEMRKKILEEAVNVS
jgi:predicted nucleotidyltransferase